MHCSYALLLMNGPCHNYQHLHPKGQCGFWTKTQMMRYCSAFKHSRFAASSRQPLQSKTEKPLRSIRTSIPATSTAVVLQLLVLSLSYQPISSSLTVSSSFTYAYRIIKVLLSDNQSNHHLIEHTVPSVYSKMVSSREPVIGKLLNISLLVTWDCG